MEPMTAQSLRGRVLVATPLIDEPTFYRSVILILAHGEEGALGVVVNRPSDLGVLEVLPEWYGVTAEPAVLFVGGPVGDGAVICLGRAEGGGPADEHRVVGPVGMIDLEDDPHTVQASVREVRIYGGYAGWSPGQLEQEIAEEAWVVADAEPDDVFAPDPDALWTRILQRQRGPAAWLANFPPDPSMN
jgi:putative transcriptional regulator